MQRERGGGDDWILSADGGGGLKRGRVKPDLNSHTQTQE